MSCLFRRRNGFYYLVTPGKGRRVWRSLHTRDESEANQAFHEIECKRRRKTSLTLGLFAEDFLRRAALALSDKTISMHRSALRNMIRVCGDIPLRKITPLDVETFRLTRATEIAPISVNIEIRSLSASFGEAQRLGLIEQNPFRGVRQLRVPYKEGRHFSKCEFSGLVASVQDPQFRDLITFAVFTMMRLGEIVHLQWDDIDLDRRIIHVRSSEEFRVKGGKPRIVPMGRLVYEFLSRLPERTGPVFVNRSGHRLTPGAVSRRFQRHVRRAGLDRGLHFHSLRHTGISWLINEGVPPQFVQRIAGHSSIKVTGVYTHIDDKNLIAAVDAFDPVPTT